MKKGYKLCPFCKSEILKDAIKCRYCKEIIPENSNKLHVGTKQCPFCKNEIKYDAVKCQYCHEILDSNLKGKVINYMKSLGPTVIKIKEKLKNGKEILIKKTRELKEKSKKKIKVDKKYMTENIYSNNVSGNNIKEEIVEKKEKINEEKDIKKDDIENLEQNIKREYSGESIKFRSRTRIYMYFLIISIIFGGLYWYEFGSENIGIGLCLTVAFFELILYIMRKHNYIKVEKDCFEIREYIGNPIKPEIVKIKYEDVKIIRFKNSNWRYAIWYVCFCGYHSKHNNGLSEVQSNFILLVECLIIFILHTLPIIIFRKNCSNVEIETKDGKITLPKISGKKQLMNILEEIKIHYTY